MLLVHWELGANGRVEGLVLKSLSAEAGVLNVGHGLLEVLEHGRGKEVSSQILHLPLQLHPSVLKPRSDLRRTRGKHS